MSIEVIASGSEARSYYRYIQKLGSLCVATEALDQQIHLQRRYAGLTTKAQRDVAKRLAPAKETAQRTLDQTDPYSPDVRLNDYFRLVSHVGFANEMALAPYIYSRGNMDARQEIADGTTGIAAQIVGEAMAIYHDAKNQTKRREASGVINEMTTIGLANLAEDGTGIMLPGSQYADLRHKIDTHYYGRYVSNRAKQKDKYFRTFVQVKSSKRQTTDVIDISRERASDVAHVYASDFNGNTRMDRFPASRLLVSEMEGIDNAMNQREILSRHSNEIQNTIYDQINPLNTEIIRRLARGVE